MIIVLIVAVIIFLVGTVFVGIIQALWLVGLCLGLTCLVIGLLMLSSRSFRERYYRENMNDPQWETRHSENAKTFMNRYHYPFRMLMGGIGLICLYCITHQQLLGGIGAWIGRLL